MDFPTIDVPMVRIESVSDNTINVKVGALTKEGASQRVKVWMIRVISPPARANARITSTREVMGDFAEYKVTIKL